MRLFLYARVSSQRQEREETVETQMSYLRRWCELNRHAIAGTYVDEAVSGTIPFPDRPEGGRLLADLPRQRPDAVAVYRLDRLGRSALVIHNAVAAFAAAPAAFLSASEGFDTGQQLGRMLMGMIALFAEFERDAFLQRSRDGKERVARQGGWPSGAPRFGYSTGPDGKPVVNADAPAVETIFQACAVEQMGMRRIARLLEAQGILPPGHAKSRSARWHHTTILQILSDPAYKGEAEWGGIAIPCPPIVAPDLWERAQRVVHDPGRLTHQPASGSQRAYLLSGLVRCGLCGRAYQGTQWKHGRRISPRHEYVCSGRTDQQFTGRRCQSPWLPGEIETEILAECRAQLHQPARLRELIQGQRQGNEDQEARLTADQHRLQRERQSLREERSELIRQLGKKRVTEADFDRRSAEIETEENALLARIRAIETRRLGLASADDALREREAFLASLQPTLRSCPLDPATMVRLCVHSIVVHPGAARGEAAVDVTYWGCQPECAPVTLSAYGDHPTLRYFVPSALAA